MDRRPLGRTGLNITPIGFGAFKIGRNQKIKYAQSYDLPGDDATATLLAAILDVGINYIDTAPAYGISEERLGCLLPNHGRDCIISTKVGETFDDGQSHYAFDAPSITASIERSRERLNREQLDCVFIHSDGRDLEIQNNTDIVATLQRLKDAGLIRAIGFSGKTPAGATLALNWADAIMVEYHLNDTSHDSIMREARERQIGVVVKKGLASGELSPEQSIRFVLAHPAVTSLVIGGLSIEHIRQNVRIAESATD